jgi:hypothetical protein
LAGFEVIIDGRFWVITEAFATFFIQPYRKSLTTIAKGAGGNQRWVRVAGPPSRVSSRTGY